MDNQKSFSPGVAAVLSFFFAGAGQVYKGQIGRGIGYFFLVNFLYACGWVTLGLTSLIGFIVHVCIIVGATKPIEAAAEPVTMGNAPSGSRDQRVSPQFEKVNPRGEGGSTPLPIVVGIWLFLAVAVACAVYLGVTKGKEVMANPAMTKNHKAEAEQAELAPKTHCGVANHDPGVEAWSGYECKHRGSLHTQWNTCLRQRAYTASAAEGGIGCPGAQRCCPGLD